MPATRIPQYSRNLIALHWLMLILIAIAYITMEFRGLTARGSAERELMKTLHYWTGFAVLGLVWARIALRALSPTPPITPAPSQLLHLAAWGAHLALYLFMIVMPVLGWVILSAEGDPISFFGIPLFPIASPSKELADYAEELHETIGNVGYFLIGLHAVAALYHHYWRRDDTLVRMAPFLGSLARPRRD